jgi:hypothetical protein
VLGDFNNHGAIDILIAAWDGHFYLYQNDKSGKFRAQSAGGPRDHWIQREPIVAKQFEGETKEPGNLAWFM